MSLATWPLLLGHAGRIVPLPRHRGGTARPSPSAAGEPIRTPMDAEGRSTGRAREGGHGDNAPVRLAFAAAALALVAIPFLAVRYGPLTDLPQQTAQVRLFLEAAGDPASPYVVQWLAPNTLALPVLGLAWAVSTPIAAGRLAMLLLALAWVAAVHWLAWRRRRPAAAAVLASTLVFCQSLYWGFYSFVIGFPVFAGWLLLTLEDARAGACEESAGGSGGPAGCAAPCRRPEPALPWRRARWFLAGAALLYLAHALWLAAALAWLALHSLFFWRRRPVGAHLARWLAVAPAAAAAAWWFGGVAGSEFATPAQWADPVWVRLRPDHLAEAAFGGLRGPVEPVLLALLLGYLALSALTNRSLRGRGGDIGLASAGGMLVAAALVLPDKYTGTIFFADRWLPPALVLLLLAAPPPRLRYRWVLPLAAAAVLAGQAAVTAAFWRRVEAEELTGLNEALAALPAAPRTLGLQLGPPSRWLRSAPFGHVVAYSQALRGGELNFSFAEMPSSPVVYKRPREVPWTDALELAPWRVRRSDFAHFDFVLIRGRDAVHAEVAGVVLEPVTAEGQWRLYRVLPPPVSPAPPAAPGAPGDPPLPTVPGAGPASGGTATPAGPPSAASPPPS